MQKLYKPEEVAEYFGIDPRTLYNWRKGIGVKTPLKSIKLGQTLRFSEQQLEDFKKSNEYSGVQI